jgi:uncharacterized protein YfeS
MKLQLLSFLLLTLTACGQTKSNAQKTPGNTNIDTTQIHSIIMSDYLPTIEKANPVARRLMNEEFYWSPIEGTAPFGNDDGADAYAGFKDWRQTHKADNPKKFLLEQIDYWGYPSFDINETSFEKLKPYLNQNELGSRYMSGIDAAIVAIAFGQLYLEGTINKDFNEIAKTAINRELLPELLAFWGDDHKDEREMKLRKMLAVLNQVS